METTLQKEPQHIGISFEGISNDDFYKTVSMPCNRCGADTPNNAAGQKMVGNCTCRKCYHAYFCYLFLNELRKANYQKLEMRAATIERHLQSCSESFRATYKEDWRNQMYKAMPLFDKWLDSGLKNTLNESLYAEANESGFIKN
jgi:hypothetical protein